MTCAGCSCSARLTALETKFAKLVEAVELMRQWAEVSTSRTTKLEEEMADLVEKI